MRRAPVAAEGWEREKHRTASTGARAAAGVAGGCRGPGRRVCRGAGRVDGASGAAPLLPILICY